MGLFHSLGWESWWVELNRKRGIRVRLGHSREIIIRYIRGTRFTECWGGERCRLRVGYFNRHWLQPSERFRLALLGRVLKAGVPIVDLLRYLGQRDGDSNYVVFHPFLRRSLCYFVAFVTD